MPKTSDDETQQKFEWESNQEVWEHIYAKKQDVLRSPCEDLLVAYFRTVGNSVHAEQKCLEVGFGSGNNSEFLASTGMECFGVEISKSAVEIASARLRNLGLRCHFDLCEKGHLPYPDEFFDVVVAWHVLSYNDEISLQQSLLEIKRVLKPGGHLLATMSTYDQIMTARGEMLREGVFQYRDANSNQDGVILIAARDEAASKRLFSVFDNLQVGYSEITFKGVTNAHWLVCGQKIQQS